MKVRNCKGSKLSTGYSACQLDFGKIKGAIMVPEGTKLPQELAPDTVEELCHADIASRIYPLGTFVEYEPNGGDVATSNVGYGPVSANGVNTRTDTYTYDKFRETVAASLMRTANTPFGVYYVDENNVIYGLNDGTDVLAPFPMSTVYPTVTPHPTSSALSTLKVNFCHQDARDVIEQLDFEQLDFDIMKHAKGLTPVKFVNVGAAGTKKYKLVEAIGGYDRSDEFATLIGNNASSVVDGVTALSYANGVFTATGDGEPKLKEASALYARNIKFIEQA